MMPLDPDGPMVLEMIRLAGRPPFETLSTDEACAAYINSRKVAAGGKMRDSTAPGPASDIKLRIYRQWHHACRQPLR